MSKRYQVKKVPECPFCGETRFIQKADGISGIKTHFCDMCEKPFWWSEREPKPTNAEIDYKASYSMLRFRWRFLFGERPFDLNIVPTFIAINPIWKAAEMSMAHRFDYVIKTGKVELDIFNQ